MFLPLSFEYTDRDASHFGRMEEQDVSYLFHMTSQKLNVVLQAAKDVLQTVNMIFETHGRALVGYCIWYRYKHDSVETYAKYITRVACHNVIHAELSAPVT
eukprot:54860-Eustigmatos_ZCMA.PRE.1